ncbi:MAG: hypothetical protein ACQES8_05350 [Thermodesulfobacteriota bacterium]
MATAATGFQLRRQASEGWTNRSSAVTIKKLCRELNATKTKYPGTDLRPVDDLVS